MKTTKVASAYLAAVGQRGGRPAKDGRNKRQGHAPTPPASAAAHLAAIGKRGGASTSPEKVAASRANGAKGGRPRKVPRV